MKNWIKNKLKNYQIPLATPNPNHASKLEKQKRVAVIGGGIAGISAASTLGEKGFAVDLFEKENFLGGKAITNHRLHRGWALRTHRTIAKAHHFLSAATVPNIIGPAATEFIHSHRDLSVGYVHRARDCRVDKPLLSSHVDQNGVGIANGIEHFHLCDRHDTGFGHQWLKPTLIICAGRHLARYRDLLTGR